MTDPNDGVLPELAPRPETPPAEQSAPAADVASQRAQPVTQILDPEAPGFDETEAARENLRLVAAARRQAVRAAHQHMAGVAAESKKNKGRGARFSGSNWLLGLRGRIASLIPRRSKGSGDEMDDEDGPTPPSAGRKKAGSINNPFNKIGAGWQILIMVALVGALSIWGLRTYVFTQSPPVSVEPPVVTELNPVDIKNVDWLAPMQITLIVASLAFFLLIVGDGQKRHQMGDAIAVMTAVFMNFAPSIPWPFGGSLGDVLRAMGLPGGMTILFGEVVIVIFVSLAGGRDFTPLGGYLALMAIGGLLTGSLGELGVALHLKTAPIVPVWQVANLIVLKKIDLVASSLWIYLLLLASVGVLTYEIVRPAVQEAADDIRPRLGSIITVVIGVIAYLVGRLGLLLAPYFAFPIALAVVLVVGAVSQGEKLPAFVPGKWSIRTMFDPAMLFVASLITFQVMSGIA